MVECSAGSICLQVAEVKSTNVEIFMIPETIIVIVQLIAKHRGTVCIEHSINWFKHEALV